MTTKTAIERVPTADLVVGDTISLELSSGFSTAVVTKIDEDRVHVERIYAHIGDIETTAGVGVSYNVERFSLPRNQTETVVRLNTSTVGQHWAAVEQERRGFTDEIARLKTHAERQYTEIEQHKAAVNDYGQQLDEQKKARRDAEQALLAVKAQLGREDAVKADRNHLLKVNTGLQSELDRSLDWATHLDEKHVAAVDEHNRITSGLHAQIAAEQRTTLAVKAERDQLGRENTELRARVAALAEAQEKTDYTLLEGELHSQQLHAQTRLLDTERANARYAEIQAREAQDEVERLQTYANGLYQGLDKCKQDLSTVRRLAAEASATLNGARS